MKTATYFRNHVAALTLFTLTLAAGFGAQAQSKGMTFQGYLKDSTGALVNTSGVSVTSQLLSPNDCVLMEETHSAVNITNGFFTVVIGKGTRTGADKGLSMRDVFNNGQTRSSMDPVTGAAGSCTYTPTANDARKVKLKFNVGADAIAADFNIRANGFAFWSEDADNSQKLGGLAPSAYLQVNSGTGLTQSSLESLVTTIGAGIPGSSITSLPWSKLTSIPAPLATIGGLSCANGQILQVSGGNWACAAAPAGNAGTVTGVTSANSYLGVTNGSTAPVLTVNVGTAANTVAAGNDSRFGNAQKLQNVNVDATVPTSGQVLKYDGTKWAPAADATGGGGGGLTGVTSTNSYLTVANGTTAPDLTLHVGTAANTVAAGDDTRFGNATKIQSVNVDTTGIASGKILKYDGTKWAIANDDSGGAPSGSATGDLSGSYPNPSVVAIRGVAVAATSAVSGQVYKYNGTDWSPVYIGLADLKKSGGGSQLPGSQCAANEKMDWVSGSDSFVCVAIDTLDAAKITTGTLATAQLPTVPLTKGGTGQTSASASFDALSPLTTKGDIVVRNATTNTRMAVGADGKFLKADSGQTNGLAWADVVATDLSSLVSTGIVQRNGSNSYSTVTVNAPLTYSAGALGVTVGTTANTLAAGDDSRFATISNKVSKAGDTMTGTLNLASNGLVAGTTQLVLSSGNVGVGTASPAVPLDVGGTARVLASVEGAAAAVNSSTAYPIPDLTRNVRRITLTANTTITLPDASTLPTDAAYSLTVRVKQDATGSRTLAWAGNTQTIKWDTGSAPAVATAANTETIYQFFIIGGETVWYGSMVWKEN